MKNTICYSLLLLLLQPAISNAQNMPELKVANGHKEYLLSGAVTSDERLLATSSNEGMIIWDMASGLALKTVSRNHRADIPFTIPGSSNFGTIHDGVIRIIDGQTFQERIVANFTVYFIVGSAVVDNSGRYLYIGAERYDGERRAVIYKVDLQQNNAQLIHEVKASSLGIIKADHNTGIGYGNLSLNSDGTKLCAKFSVNHVEIANNFSVFNTQTFQKEKEWNAPGQSMGFINNDLMWHFGKTLFDKTIPQPTGTLNINVISYPSLQLQKSVNAKAGSISSIVTNANKLYDPVAKKFYFASNRGLTTLDIATKSIVTIFADTGYVYSGVNLLLPISKKVVQSTGAGALSKFDPATMTRTAIGGGKPIVASEFTSNPKWPILSIYSHMYNSFQLIDLRSEVVKVYNHKETSSTALSWSPDGKSGVFYDLVGRRIGIFKGDDPSAAPRTIASVSYGSSDAIEWSADSKLFAIGTSGGIWVWNAEELQMLRRLPGSERYIGGRFCFSNDGSKIVSCIKKPSVADPQKVDYWLQCYNVNDGSKVWEAPAPENLWGLRYTANGASIFGFSEGATYHFNALSGAQQRKNGNTRIVYWSNFSPDDKLLFTPLTNSLGAIDVQTGSLSYTIPSSINNGGRSTMLPGGEFVVSSNSDNSLHFYDLKRKMDVGKLFTFYNSDEYAFISRNNYFEGTQAATSKMYFVKDNRILPLESLFEKFYSPKILQNVFARTEPGPPVVNINTIKAAPTAKISYTLGKRNLTVEDDKPSTNNVSQSNITITVQATAPGDKVNEIRLYQNGKLIANNTRNLVVSDDDEGLEKRNYEVTLGPGNNSFSAVSINSQRTESMPAQITLNFIASKTPADKVPSAVAQNTSTTMYLVIIGINQYKNPKYNLNYAVADAKGFQEKINGSCGTLMKECKPFFISNDQATKENIVKTLQTIADKATAKDMFVFYYAGHGVMNDAVQKEFFLVPHDVTQLYGNDDGLTVKGISSAELQKLSTTIKAQKQLFILDACQSAGALQQVASRGVGEEKAIAQLARSTGTHWLTASGSDQFASEFDKLGHGAFTYVLMNGLAGGAAIEGGSITVNSLKAYIESKVPEITQQYKGSPQYPASYGFGQDFPIGVKK